MKPATQTLCHSTFLPALVMIACLCKTCLAQEQQEPRNLNEHLQAFAPYEGAWICEDSWMGSDAPFWAQNSYSIGMNGNFFEAVTATKNASGGIYQRYKTTWLYNAKEQRLETYGFTFDGSVTQTYPQIDSSGEGHPVIRSQWQQAEGSHIRQEVQMNADEKSYQWRVWSSTDEKEWTPLMDGTWKKQGD